MTGRLPANYSDPDIGSPAPGGGETTSPRSRGVALILGVLGGPVGLHRFYVGRPQSAVFMALTLGGMGVWWFYDMVLLFAGEFRDADDLPLLGVDVGDVLGAGVAVGGLELVAEFQSGAQ